MAEIIHSQIKGWSALSQRERNALLAILAGTSFSGAAVANGLNPSRLRKHNARFMGALWHAQKLQQQAAREPDAKVSAEPEAGDIYQQAAALQAEQEKEMATWTPERRAAYYEAERERLRAEWAAAKPPVPVLTSCATAPKAEPAGSNEAKPEPLEPIRRPSRCIYCGAQAPQGEANCGGANCWVVMS